MFTIATSAAHIGACLVLLPSSRSKPSLQHRHSIGKIAERFVAIARIATAPVRLSQQRF
jgi:hypothetical protein